MIGLTAAQARAYDAVAAHIRRTGQAPTRSELMRALGLRSKNAVQHLVECLVERGWLRREQCRARGLALATPQYFRWDDETKELVEWRP